MKSDALLCPPSQYTPPQCLEHHGLTSVDRLFLLQLQKQALQYFLDNQLANGLVLDRQRNTGPLQTEGICSLAATGMGLMALALATAPPFRLLTPSHAAVRIRTALETVLHSVPHDHGVIPHFLHSATGAVLGDDHFSTIETAWLLAGALWAGSFLKDKEVETLAGLLFERVDWQHWTGVGAPGDSGLLRHAKRRDGDFFVYTWDRLNGETAFMYVLAAGAAEGKSISANSWAALRPFYGTAAGLRFNNADLGLFVFQYGLDLLDLYQWQAPGEVDLMAEVAAGDAGQPAGLPAGRRHLCYLPNLLGTVCRRWPWRPTRARHLPLLRSGRSDRWHSADHGDARRSGSSPRRCAREPGAAEHDAQWRAHGRYGFSNINVDRSWVGRDIVGIDAGAAMLALDNFLMHGRVRAVFANLPCVRAGMDRLGFTSCAEPLRQAS